MQVHRRPAWLLTGLLLLAACGGGGNDDGDAAPRTSAAPRRATTSTSPPTSPSTSSTTSSAPTTTTSAPAVDPSVIPEDPAAIDEAYVEAVLEEHNRVIGDALRLQLEGADLQEIVDRYNAIYVPEVADLLLTDALGEDQTSMDGYKRPPGDATTSVESVDEATTTCIFTRVQQDNSALLVDPREQFSSQVVLRARPPSSEKSNLNETAWLSEGLEPASADGETRCVAD